MKSLRILTMALALVVVAGVAASRPASASVSVSFDFFHSNLSHHGSWHVSGSYGRVWQPSVYRSGWNPYYDGRWEYTDAGWSWDSDYEWGDIPYHYGTWVMDPVYGWVWVPGYTWAPSWVEFREGPDYIGWGPVAPSFSIGVSFGHVYRPNHFVFVRSRDFMCDRVRSYAVPHRDVNIIFNRTTIINNNIRIENNIVVNRGPDRRFVERATRRRINAVPIDRVRSVNRLEARGVSRQDIRVDRRMDRRGLRAAEPFSANRPLPSASQGGFDRGRSVHNDRGQVSRGGRDFDRSAPNRLDRRGRNDADRGGELSAPSRRAPESAPRMRDDLRRGRDRQEAGTTGDALRRGQAPRDDRRPRSERPSLDSRQDRSRSSGSRDEASRSAPRSLDRERPRSRPDEGRMFRGVREREEAPRAQRSAPQRERMSDRSRDRSSSRARGAERRQKSERPKERKERDRDR